LILTDDDIREAIARGDISVEPFDEGQIQPASIDLRVGVEGATTKNKHKVNLTEKGLIILEPGDFGVIAVLEKIKFGPQYVGRIGLRSKYARRGLIATTGPQIDPGFHGTITLGLANLTPRPVSLSYRDDILTLEIHRLDKPAANPYSGPYQGRFGLSAEDLDSIAQGEGMAFSEVLTTLRSLSTNVADLTSQMKTMQWMLPTITAIGFAVVAVLVAIQ
jgi:dCTP deaminase